MYQLANYKVKSTFQCSSWLALNVIILSRVRLHSFGMQVKINSTNILDNVILVLVG